MLSPRLLAANVLLGLVILLGLNGFVLWLEHHSNKQQVLNRLAAPGPIEGIFSGSSLVELGVDQQVFAHNWPEPTARFLNCGLGDTSTVEHCLILRQALRLHPEARFVVYCFAGSDMTVEPDGSWDSVRANRTVSYYLEPDLAAQLYGASPLDRLRFDFVRFLPLATERYLLWNRVELLRRYLQGIGLKGNDTNSYGRAEDFQSLEVMWSGYALRDGRRVVDEHLPLAAAVTKLIQSAHTDGRHVFIVELPLPPAYLDLVDKTEVWQRYRAYITPLLQQAGATYIDAHDWVTDPADFLDALHLNPSGAALFSAKLAQTIAPQVIPPAR